MDSAAAPQVYFGNPSLCDSLVIQIAAAAGDNPDTLLDLLDTPWATRYDIARRALLVTPERSRIAVIARLKGKNSGPTAGPLLNVFRELGKPGDEPVLDAAFRSGNPSLRVLACRCLARFGSPERSWGLLAPQLESSSVQARLAAAWAVGEVMRRNPQDKPPSEIRHGLNSLMRDPSPHVRYTAWESLELLDSDRVGGTAPLYPPE